jgi:hypothetical protein
MVFYTAVFYAAIEMVGCLLSYCTEDCVVHCSWMPSMSYFIIRISFLERGSMTQHGCSMSNIPNHHSPTHNRCMLVFIIPRRPSSYSVNWIREPTAKVFGVSLSQGMVAACLYYFSHRRPSWEVYVATWWALVDYIRLCPFISIITCLVLFLTSVFKWPFDMCSSHLLNDKDMTKTYVYTQHNLLQYSKWGP